MIAREARRLATAAAFLTRLPVAPRGGPTAEELGSSARYFPLVGAAVGALGAAVLLAAWAVLPPAVAVVLSVMATVLTTGALHEDGLADACDAFGGGATREEVLRILEDPRIGAYGALGLLLVTTLKLATLAHLPVLAAATALLCGHAFSRALCVLVMAAGRYAKATGGRTRAVAAGARAPDALIALALGCLPFVFAPAVFLWTLPAMLLAALLLQAYFRARLGGYTGDTLGAVQQLAEVACYTTLLGVL